MGVTTKIIIDVYRIKPHSIFISCLNVEYVGKKLGIGEVIIAVISKRDKVFEISSNCSQKADCCVVSISLSLQTRPICCALTIVLHIQSLNNERRNTHSL